MEKMRFEKIFYSLNTYGNALVALLIILLLFYCQGGKISKSRYTAGDRKCSWYLWEQKVSVRETGRWFAGFTVWIQTIMRESLYIIGLEYGSQGILIVKMSDTSQFEAVEAAMNERVENSLSF